jgi:hypothetical protein
VNLLAARVVLRVRTLSDILDLAAPFCLRGWRLLLPLWLVVMGPALGLCLTLRYAYAWSWWDTWKSAFILTDILQGLFTLAAGDLLFHRAGARRIAPVFAHMRRRLFAYILAHLGSRAALVVAAVSVILAPFTFVWMLFAHEAVLLEAAPPMRSLGRSFRFVKHHGWRCFALVLALTAAPAGFALAAEALGQGLVGFTLQLGKPFGDLFEDGGSVFALIGFFLAIPYVAAARFLAYIDIRTRKEGWDIQLRFMSMAARGQEGQDRQAGQDQKDGKSREHAA